MIFGVHSPNSALALPAASFFFFFPLVLQHPRHGAGEGKSKAGKRCPAFRGTGGTQAGFWGEHPMGDACSCTAACSQLLCSSSSSPVSRGGFWGWRAARQPARASLAAGDDSALTFARGLAGGEATCLASRLLSSKASPAPRTRLRRCPWESTSRKFFGAGEY